MSRRRTKSTARSQELFVKLGQRLMAGNDTWRASTLAERGLFADLSWQSIMQCREFIRFGSRAQLAGLLTCRLSDLNRVIPKMTSRPMPLIGHLHDPATGKDQPSDAVDLPSARSGVQYLRVIGVRMLFPEARPWEDERDQYAAWAAQHDGVRLRESDKIEWGPVQSTAGDGRSRTNGAATRSNGAPTRIRETSKSGNAYPRGETPDVRPRDRHTSIPPLPPPQGAVPTAGVDDLHGNGPFKVGEQPNGTGNDNGERPPRHSPEAALYDRIVDAWPSSTSRKAHANELMARAHASRAFRQDPLTLLAWARGVARSLAEGGIRSPWLCLGARLKGKARSTEPADKDRAWVKAELRRRDDADA